MENWKILIRFTFPHEAHLAKNYLESEGITTFMKDELTAQVNNFYSHAIGGVKLLVNEQDHDRAIQVLIKGGYLDADESKPDVEVETYEISSESEKEYCPYCGSQNFGKVKQPNLLSVIIVFLLGAFFPIFRRHYHCYDCDHRWVFRKIKAG